MNVQKESSEQTFIKYDSIFEISEIIKQNLMILKLFCLVVEGQVLMILITMKIEVIFKKTIMKDFK